MPGGPYAKVAAAERARIWSKIKNVVKRHIRVPEVVRPGLGEQRLQYVEQHIDAAMTTITPQDRIVQDVASMRKAFSHLCFEMKTWLPVYN